MQSDVLRLELEHTHDSDAVRDLVMEGDIRILSGMLANLVDQHDELNLVFRQALILAEMMKGNISEEEAEALLHNVEDMYQDTVDLLLVSSGA
jgi:hypothetical protein